MTKNYRGKNVFGEVQGRPGRVYHMEFATLGEDLELPFIYGSY